MPASMIRPDTGSRWKVSGNSMAMVAIGPIPGSTPINVPIRAPISAKPRLARVRATENPVARLASTCSMQLPVGPDRDRKPEAEDEDRPGQHAHAGGRGERLPDLEVGRRQARHREQDENRQHETEWLKRQC